MILTLASVLCASIRRLAEGARKSQGIHPDGFILMDRTENTPHPLRGIFFLEKM